MNQGISQGLSYLIYTIIAVALFSVALAVLGGGYGYGKSTQGTASTADDYYVFFHDKEQANIANGTDIKIDSVFQQFGTSLHR